MPFNGAGAYSLPAGSIVADGTTIDAADHNTPLQDVESSLSTVTLRNGATPFTGNQSFGNNKITSLAAGTVSTDAVNKGQMDTAIAAGDALKANLAGGNTFTGDQIVNSGTFRLNTSFPAYYLFPTTGTANQRAFRIQADSGNFTVIGVDDSNNQQNFPFQIAWGGNAIFNTSALIVSPVSGIGYGTGSGGSVTQTTGKSTAVTLNRPSGVIIMNNQALAAGANVQFTFNNSVILSTDVLLLTVTGNTFTGYRVEPVNILTGQAGIRVTNVTGSTLSDALTINFAILRCATS